MYSKIRTEKYMSNYSEQIDKLKAALANADAVIVGAGAGLSTSAGYTYSGERFNKYFFDFTAAYGFTDMYVGGFYHYETAEEYWAYWSRYVYINRYAEHNIDAYENLLKLLCGRDYFVITTNVDHCFQKAGFDKKRLFYTQGDYGLFQCSTPCRSVTFDNEKIICEMVKRQENMRIPSQLIPHCPYCGAPMTMNLRADDKFVEDEGWHTASMRYADFIRTRKNTRVLFLELGVGYNTPAIIKYPFWRMTGENPDAVYACVNLDGADCPPEIKRRSICINADISRTLSDLL